MEYQGKFGYTLGQIQHIAIMGIIFIYYTVYSLVTQTVSPTLPCFYGIKNCIQYLASHSHKPIFILLIVIMYQMSSNLHGMEIKVKTT